MTRSLRFVLSPAARQDVREILLWSVEHFGSAAATRYRALLTQALRDVQDDPLRRGSRDRSELYVGARTYHLSSCSSVPVPLRVKTPRHLILYCPTSTVLNIARILHDSRNLARRLPDVSP